MLASVTHIHMIFVNVTKLVCFSHCWRESEALSLTLGLQCSIIRTPDAKIAEPGAAQEAFLKQLDGRHLTDCVLESLSDAYSWKRLFVVALSALETLLRKAVRASS
jgi:hypothetical protein